MLKQNPAYEWLFIIFFLTVCTGCGMITGDLREAVEYQVAKKIRNEGKRQLKDQLKNGMSFDEYERRYKDLKIQGPKGNLIDTDVIIITKKGKLRLAKKEQEAFNRDLNKIIGFKKEKVHLGLSFSLDRVTATVDYDRYEFKFKQYYDGTWRFLFEYEIKF